MIRMGGSNETCAYLGRYRSCAVLRVPAPEDDMPTSRYRSVLIVQLDVQQRDDSIGNRPNSHDDSAYDYSTEPAARYHVDGDVAARTHYHAKARNAFHDAGLKREPSAVTGDRRFRPSDRRQVMPIKNDLACYGWSTCYTPPVDPCSSATLTPTACPPTATWFWALAGLAALGVFASGGR